MPEEAILFLSYISLEYICASLKVRLPRMSYYHFNGFGDCPSERFTCCGWVAQSVVAFKGPSLEQLCREFDSQLRHMI